MSIHLNVAGHVIIDDMGYILQQQSAYKIATLDTNLMKVLSLPLYITIELQSYTESTKLDMIQLTMHIFKEETESFG